MRLFPRLALLLTAGLSLTAADAPPSDIVARRADVQLSTNDLRDSLSRADTAARDQMLNNPQALSEFVKERMMRQILLKEATTAKWDQNPDAIARANEARDIAMVQSWLGSRAQLDPNYPSQGELESVYETNKGRFVAPPQFHIAQIAILVPAGSTKDFDDAARRKTADIRAQLLKPKADFSEIAKKNSQDNNSASKGGDLGWLREDQIMKPVRDVIVGMTENAVSEPVRGNDAWHVVKLLGSKPAGTVPLEQVKAQLVNTLRQNRAQQLINAYIEDLLRKEPVQINEIGLSDRLKANK